MHCRPSLSELNALLEKEGVDLEVDEKRSNQNFLLIDLLLQILIDQKDFTVDERISGSDQIFSLTDHSLHSKKTSGRGWESLSWQILEWELISKARDRSFTIPHHRERAAGENWWSCLPSFTALWPLWFHTGAFLILPPHCKTYFVNLTKFSNVS